MQLLKISFVLSLTISLCSFAYLTATEDGREELYNEFLSEFKKVNISKPFKLEARYPQLEEEQTINKKQSKKIEVAEERHILGGDYATFIPDINRGMMSRMGPSTYEAEAMVASNDQYNAVIYSESRSFNMGSKSFYMATYSKEGHQISVQYLGYAGSNSFVEMDVAKNKNMSMTVKEMIKKDNTKKYDANQTKKMMISPKGEILVHGEKKVEPLEIPQKQSKKSKFNVG